MLGWSYNLKVKGTRPSVGMTLISPVGVSNNIYSVKSSYPTFQGFLCSFVGVAQQLLFLHELNRSFFFIVSLVHG